MFLKQNDNYLCFCNYKITYCDYNPCSFNYKIYKGKMKDNFITILIYKFIYCNFVGTICEFAYLWLVFVKFLCANNVSVSVIETVNWFYNFHITFCRAKTLFAVSWSKNNIMYVQYHILLDKIWFCFYISVLFFGQQIHI